jgi:putative phosphoribosyl transferase
MDNPTIERFQDRGEAGRLLASRLVSDVGGPNLLVLALPRGGVPVGFEIARALHSPLDVILVRKLGVPGQEELAMGAVASGNVRILQSDVVEALNIPRSVIEKTTAKEIEELLRREQRYRRDRPSPQIQGRDVILVDDGLATGATMHAAVAAVKQQHPRRITVAVPVATRKSCQEFKGEVDEIVCLKTPQWFYAVGRWYERFPELTDEEVCDLLRRAEKSLAATDSACDLGAV